MKGTIIKGAAWNSLASYITIGLNLLGTLILARLLTPDQFGTIAYMTSIYALCMMMIGWGVVPYIVKAKRSFKKIFDVISTIQILSALALFIILISVYPLIFSAEVERHFLYFAAAGIGYTTVATGATSRAVLLRGMQYKRIALINIAAAVIGVGVAVGTGFLGAGLWPLVMLSVGTDFLKNLMFLAISPRKPTRFSFHRKTLREFFRFAKFNIVAAFTGRAYQRADDIALKNVVGTEALGFYSQAYKITELFPKLTWGAIGSVGSSAFGILKNKRKALENTYYVINATIIRALLLFILPLLLLTRDFVVLIYGSKWTPIAPILQVFSIYALLATYRRINKQINLYSGDSKAVARTHLAQLITFIVALIPGLYFLDAIGAAIAVDIGLIAGLFPLLRSTRQKVKLNLRKVFLKPLVASAITSVIYILGSQTIPVEELIWKVILHGLVILALYASILLLFERKSIPWLLRQIKYLRKHKNETKDAKEQKTN